MFAAHVGGKDDSAYIQLFDAIDQQTAYNEQALKTSFAKAPFIRNLSANKNYLQSVILKALLSFHSSPDTEIGRYQQIGTVDILFQKGLFEQCAKLISKYKQEAALQENFQAQTQLLEWEARIGARNHDYSAVALASEKQLQLLQIQQQITHLKIVAFQLYTLSHQVNPASRSSTTKQLTVAAKNLFKIQVHSLSTCSEKYYYHTGAFFYYMATHQSDKALQEVRVTVALFEEHPDYLKAHKRLFSSAIQNLCVALLTIGQTNETAQLLQELEDLFQLSGHTPLNEIHASALNTLINLELVIEINNKQITRKRIEQLNQKVTAFKQRYHTYIRKIDVADLHLNLGMAYFLIKDYHKSSDYLNMILNQGRYMDWPPVYKAARLLLMIINFELHHHKLLFHQIDSTRKFLQRQNELGAFEQALLRYLKSNQLQDFKNLEHLFKNTSPPHKAASILFDFIASSTWLQEQQQRFNTSLLQ